MIIATLPFTQIMQWYLIIEKWLLWTVSKVRNRVVCFLHFYVLYRAHLKGLAIFDANGTNIQQKRLF